MTAVFPRAEIGKQMDKEDVVHIVIYAMDYYSAVKKEEILPSVINMNGP